MDSLTHGLLGAAIAALPWPKRLEVAEEPKLALRAGIVVGVIAAELPDLDYLWPASDDVMHALRAHRGLTLGGHRNMSNCRWSRLPRRAERPRDAGGGPGSVRGGASGRGGR